jgi:galactonate dehydratase
MKITDIQTYLVGNPWKGWLFIRVDTDEGLHGIGEGTLGQLSPTVASAAQKMKSMILGYDPFGIESILLRLTRDLDADGGQIKMCAVSAIEMACWDIIGKALGSPVYNLLGGRCREKVRAYANGWYRCPRTPAAFADAAKAVVKLGYTAMKFDPFGVAWRTMDRKEEDLSIDIITAVREAVGPHMDLAIEAHSRFNVSTAIRVGKRMEPMAPVWYEDPIPHSNPRGIVEVARRVNIPVGTGECLTSKQQFIELLREGAINIVTLEPLHVGGILATRKIADLVDAYQGVIVPHNAQGPICTLAGLQIAACTPNHFMQEHFDLFNVDWGKDLMTWIPKLVDGYLEIPTTPGLGADLNLEVVKEHPCPERLDITLWEVDWHFRRESVPER